MSESELETSVAAGTRVPAERLRKGQLVTVTIESLSSGGEGVSRDLGWPVFVNRTAPGDKVEVKLFDVRKDFAKGEVVRIVEPSSARHEPPCKLFRVCGGCQWQHIRYEEQLEYKAEIVRQAMKRIGNIDPSLVKPAIGAVQPLYYRNKVQFPVSMVAGTGRVLAGYYEQNSHELVNIKHCPVQPEPLDRVLELSKELLEELRISIYDETTHRGLVRHIAQRFSFAFDKVLVTLVLNAQPNTHPDLESKLVNFAGYLMEQVPEVSGVCVNFNSSKGNRILGEVTRCLGGEAFINERLRSHLPDAPQQLRDGILFRLSTSSFFQVNSLQAEVLLDQVLLGAAYGASGVLDSKVPLIVDAYAGVGTMASWLGAAAEKIIAIEEMASAVKDGVANLALNGMDNVEFINARVEQAVPRLLNDGIRADVVVVDPPRKGIDPVGLDALVQLGARKIVYVSCNPATLARDLRLFSEKGYRTRQIQPIDMFPQTFHIECVSILERES